MTTRVRDWLLLAAGVPGVIALFLPVYESPSMSPIEWYGNLLQELNDWPTAAPFYLWGLDWAVALPVPILLLQVSRVLTEREMPRAVLLTMLASTLLLQLGGVGLALKTVTEIQWFLPRDWLEPGPDALYSLVPMLVLSAANLWLLHRHWRQGASPVSTVEVFMMGTYVVAQTFWLQTELLAEPTAGPKLMLWTSLVYAVTVAIRLHSRYQGTTLQE